MLTNNQDFASLSFYTVNPSLECAELISDAKMKEKPCIKEIKIKDKVYFFISRHETGRMEQK